MRCNQKKCHETREYAEAAILHMLECCPQLPGNENLRVYECFDCGFFHIGRDTDERRVGRRVTLATLPRRRLPKEGVTA